MKDSMQHHFSHYTKAELLDILSNERKNFILAIDQGSPASHLEEIRRLIRLIQAVITEKEKLSGRTGQ